MAKNSILDVTEILNEYSEDIQEAISDVIPSIAKKGVSTLKNTSPKNTGKYSRGWRVKTQKGRGNITSTIYNATDWQLTHLLEKPHLKRNGGLTTPKIHIKPVEEQCISETETKITNIIKNGG